MKIVGALVGLLRLGGCEKAAREIQPSKQDPGLLLRKATRRRKAFATRRAKKDAADAGRDNE